MPANTMPVTVRVPKGVGFKITAAQTDQTGATSANIVTGYTFLATGAAPADGQGGPLQGFRIRVPVTSIAAVVQLFRNTGGVRTALGPATVVTPITVAVGTGGFDSQFIPITAYFLPGDKIDGLSTVAQETHVDLVFGEW